MAGTQNNASLWLHALALSDKAGARYGPAHQPSAFGATIQQLVQSLQISMEQTVKPEQQVCSGQGKLSILASAT